MGSATPEIDLAGVSVGARTVEEWLAYLSDPALPRGHHHVSLNAAKWVGMTRDPALRAAVRAAGSVGADGVGIVLAACWLGTPLPGRAPGIEIAHGLLARAAAEQWPVALIGAAPPVLAAVEATLRARGVSVVSSRHGYFGPAEEAQVVRAVGAHHPRLLLVALGTPRAEVFVQRHRAELDSALILGVGGTFDVLAGRARRVPAPIGRFGLEWAWRLAADPRRRFRRAILDSATFVGQIARGARIP